MQEAPELLIALAWLESHSGTTSLLSLAVAVLSGLFMPSTWRRILASIFAGLSGFAFLPYDPNHWKIWSAKAFALAVVFIIAYWGVIQHYRSWRASRQLQLTQPSGTFETIVDRVSRIPGDSNVRVQLSTDQGTLTITKKPVQLKKDS